MRAFSLIEATVVMGVIGLVMGGIWIAASNLSYERRMRQTADGMMVIRDNFIRFMAGAPGPFSVSTNTTGLPDIMIAGADGYRVRAGRIIMPLDNGRTTTPSVITFLYYKGPPDVTLASGAVVSSYISATVVARNITKQDCVRLSREVATRSRDLIQVVINPNGVFTDMTALTLDDCSSASTGAGIAYYFAN